MKKITLTFAVLFVAIAATSAQWQQTTAPTGSSINCLMEFSASIFAGTADSGIYISTDAGSHWVTRNNGITNLDIKAIGVGENGMIYAGSKSLTLFTSADTGATWIARYVGGTGTAISSVAHYDSIMFVGEVGDGVFKSVNNGVSWSEVGLCCASVLSLCADTNGYVFAGTATSVYRSNGTFTSWTKMNNGLPSGSVRAIFKSGNLIFAGSYGNGIYVSSDHGDSWSEANSGLTDLHILSLAGNDSKIIAGTEAGGVFVSVDHGLTWIPANEGLSLSNIPSLQVSDSFLYAGTTDGGVWKRLISEFTAVEEIVPDNRAWIYPNPASDLIRLNVNRDEEVTLNIYTIMGVLVKAQAVGPNDGPIEVGDLKNGVYLVEIETISYTEKQKLIIQR